MLQRLTRSAVSVASERAVFRLFKRGSESAVDPRTALPLCTQGGAVVRSVEGDDDSKVSVRKFALADVAKGIEEPRYGHHHAVLGSHLGLNRVELRTRADQRRGTVDLLAAIRDLAPLIARLDEGVPSSVELRWRPVVDQAALASSS